MLNYLFFSLFFSSFYFTHQTHDFRLHLSISFCLLLNNNLNHHHNNKQQSTFVSLFVSFLRLRIINFNNNRTFANETNQFLAPYDQSVIKSRNGSGDGPLLAAAAANIGGSNPGLILTGNNAQQQHAANLAALQLGLVSANANALTSSFSNSELAQVPFNNFPLRTANANVASTAGSLEGRVDAWNPFEEAPFSQMTEDHIFEAEFDKLRQRGSQSSKYF